MYSVHEHAAFVTLHVHQRSALRAAVTGKTLYASNWLRLLEWSKRPSSVSRVLT